MAIYNMFTLREQPYENDAVVPDIVEAHSQCVMSINHTAKKIEQEISI